MRHKSWLWMALLLLVLGVGFGAGYLMRKGSATHNPPPPPRKCFDLCFGSAGAPLPPSSASVPASAAAGNPATNPTSAATLPAGGAVDAAAAADLRKGLDLLKQDHLIDARSALSEALLSDRLTVQQEKQAQGELEKLAQKTIFSDEVVEDDPYAYYHTIQPGDVLVRLERRECDGEGLHVPVQLLLRINRLSRAEDIRSGQRIKLIRGPFHAIVSKSRFTVDIFLQRDNLPRVWVARVGCGLGRNGSTPVGAWRVGKDGGGGNVVTGGKLMHPTWTPTESSGLSGEPPIPYGQPGYALGTKGLWIGLVGTDESTRGKQHYGIHSTSDPASIGKEQSSGCIRLADDDIELLYSLLYEVHSTVRTKP